MQTHAAPAEAGTLERNKDVVRRFVAEIFVAGRPEAVDELVADDFVPHSWPSTGDPRGDLKRAIDRVGDGLEDPEFTVEDLIAEGDRVAARLTTSATHVGEFMGMAATGKRYTIEEIHIFRLRDGLVIEHWHQFNPLALMQQLGVSPPS
jgi:steroid delta-isomerase-like uncharacterized protein